MIILLQTTGAADVGGFLLAAGAAAFLAKLLVDGIKIAVDLPRAAPVILAFVGAQLFQFGLLMTQEVAFTSAVIASAAITGFVAWGLAIGATMAQTKGDKVDERIDVALKMNDKNATKDDVDRAVGK
jgi:hypothetical protein